MRAVRAIWRVLSHPALSVAGNLSLLLTLGPFVIAALVAAVGRILDQPVLFVVALGVALLGIVIALVKAVSPRPSTKRLLANPSYAIEQRAPKAMPATAQAPLGGRIYGSGAIRQGLAAQRQRGVWEAVEGEIALAHEEAIEMAKMLGREWPHTIVEGALAKTALPDWRAKTTEFIGAVLGSARRSAFKGAGIGGDELARLKSEGKFLSDLALNLLPDSVRVDEQEVLKARQKRRDHGAANFLKYDHVRAPGAPPTAGTLGREAADCAPVSR